MKARSKRISKVICLWWDEQWRWERRKMCGESTLDGVDIGSEGNFSASTNWMIFYTFNYQLIEMELRTISRWLQIIDVTGKSMTKREKVFCGDEKGNGKAERSSVLAQWTDYHRRTELYYLVFCSTVSDDVVVVVNFTARRRTRRLSSACKEFILRPLGSLLLRGFNVQPITNDLSL